MAALNVSKRRNQCEAVGIVSSREEASKAPDKPTVADMFVGGMAITLL